MASSKPLTSSIRKGQTYMVCQLCENDPKLKWKCLECRLMMCQRCRDKVHSKFASADDHTIIDIKDISKHQEEQKPDFTKLKCTEHAGQKCCLFCQPCDQLACPVCVTKIHKSHELIQIHEGFEMKIEKIKGYQENVKVGLQTVFKGESEIRKMKYLEYFQYKKSKQAILDQESVLIDAVIKHSRKLFAELETEWNEVSKSINKEEKLAKKSKETLLQQNDEVNDLLQSNDPKRIFSENLNDSTVINIKPVDTDLKHVPNFVPGKKLEVASLHGKLEKDTIPISTSLQVVQSIQTDLYTAAILVVCPDNSLWVSDLKTAQNVYIVVDNMGVISNFKLPVKCLTITSNADLLLSIEGSSVIKVIPSGTEEVKDSPYNIWPLQPMGIHVTQDNKIIIGARNIGEAFPVTGPRQVIVLDHTGQQEKVFQYDSHKKPLFTIPFRVTSTSDNSIGVVDMLSEDFQGRVVILNNEGGLINIYTGHPDVNNDDYPFTPLDITTTPSVNFVISDCENHTLHILSSNGEIITYYNTEELRIELPWSLSFSHTGQLYIGCDTFQECDEKAHIYKIENFLW